ncbi:MAG: 50S ribosomal protein L25 [Planctomycetaceae bacterium]
MATTVKLAVQLREKAGTAESRRLRKRGFVPGNVYGHGGAPVNVSVPADQITPMVFAGQRVVELDLNDGPELTLLRDVQWDTFGTRILHFDLIRVDRDEKVEVEVAVELRGTAPGVTAGGILNHHLHGIAVKCPAFAIPNSVVVKIGDLEIGQSIHVGDLEFASEVDVLNPAEAVVVQVNAPVHEVEEEEDALSAGPIEPEVIGRKDEGEEQSE